MLHSPDLALWPTKELLCFYTPVMVLFLHGDAMRRGRGPLLMFGGTAVTLISTAVPVVFLWYVPRVELPPGKNGNGHIRVTHLDGTSLVSYFPSHPVSSSQEEWGVKNPSTPEALRVLTVVS